MFPLAGKDFPTTANELAAALRAILAEHFTISAAGESVHVTGVFPSLESIRINLDGAIVREAGLVTKPSPAVSHQPGFVVETLNVSGRAVTYQRATLNVTTSGTGLTFMFGRDGSGRPLLVLNDARSGTVEAEISKNDVEGLLLIAAATWATAYGIAVQEVGVELVSNGPRSINAVLRLKAKKMMMSGVIIITGRLDIGDNLQAKLSDLACTGEGMVGSTAAAIVRRKIEPYEGTLFPLDTPLLGEVRLHDVAVRVDDAVHISATFGK